jgi:hypothetical protein
VSRIHTQALVAKTRQIPAFASSTFVTVAPKGTVAPYVLWHPVKGTNTADRFDGPRVTKHPRFTGHIVGESADQVQVLTDLLEGLLLPGGRGVRLDVLGERARSLMFSCPLPVQVLSDPLPEVIYSVVEVSWDSDPLP